MSKLNKAITVLAKIFEIFMWIVMVALIVGAVLLGVAGASGAIESIDMSMVVEGMESASADLAEYGIDASTFDLNQIIRVGIVLCIGGAISCGLMAKVCRNINLIFKTAEGLTEFSQGATPFQPENIRMVREIGYLCLAIPVMELILSIIAPFAVGSSQFHLSIDLQSIFMGLVALGLSQFFVYGAELQAETDGLV